MNLKQYLIGKDINTAIKYLETKCNGRYIGADGSESDDGYEEYFYATDKYIIILGFNKGIINNVRFDTLNNIAQYEPVFESKKYSKISESVLKRIITESVKKVLKEGQLYDNYGGDDEYYICSETDYNGGKVDYWIGNKSEADECNQCSEGSAIGPFGSYGEALDYASENGINISDSEINEDNATNKVMNKLRRQHVSDDATNKVMKQTYKLWNQKPNRRQHLSDDEINNILSSDEKTDKAYKMIKGGMAESRNVVKLSESQLHNMIAKSIKRVLKEETSRKD